jgi:hypothetical protein
LDGTETDTDCGGSACPKCGAGKLCLVAADCTSGNCVDNDGGGVKSCL